MKILAIGNSFSQDATRYIESIAGGELYVRNLYIGGCSLRTHAAHVKDGAAAYMYEKDAEAIEPISMQDALTREKWDMVTVQQVSGESGLVETYEPYIGEVMDLVRTLAPQAKIHFHKTWAYENSSLHGAFHYYRSDRHYMKARIDSATKEIAEKYGLPVIPVGDAVAVAREYAEFDATRGGIDITRDGFHLSLDYGRYLAGLVWNKYFTGKSAAEVEFVPEACDNAALVEIVKKAADAVL